MKKRIVSLLLTLVTALTCLTPALAASAGGGRDRVTPLVEMLLRMRMEAKAAKDWATSDRIRDELTAIGIRVKDRKDGFDWEIE